MSNLLEDCEKHFGTKKLYEVLGIEKDANDGQIKSAYRKKSLKVHPDRALENQKETAKEAFQTLSKVYRILSNEESRRVYDETGMVLSDDESSLKFESFEDAIKFWREVFPKISTQQIDEFASKYRGSEEEKKDLKENYLRFEGDLDKVFQYQMFYDEERVQEMIKKMIDDETVPAFDAFTNEKSSKTLKRTKMIEKEKLLAEKEEKKKNKKKNNENNDTVDDDLVTAILANRQKHHSNLVSSLEAKYSKRTKNNKKVRLS